jgi:hypothetical protein
MGPGGRQGDRLTARMRHECVLPLFRGVWRVHLVFLMNLKLKYDVGLRRLLKSSRQILEHFQVYHPMGRHRYERYRDKLTARRRRGIP